MIWSRVLPEAILSVGGTLVLVIGAVLQNTAMRDLLRWISLVVIIGAGLALLSRTGAGSDAWTVVQPLTSAFALAILTLVGWAILVGRSPVNSSGEWFALLIFVGLAGVVLSRAGNLAAIFLGIETLSLALYVLVSFFYEKGPSLKAGIIYLITAGYASGFLVFGMALIYFGLGSLQIDHIRAGMEADGAFNLIPMVGIAMMLVGVGFKLSLVPFHMWAGDVYEGAPSTAAGVLASASKGATLAALVPLAFLFQPYEMLISLLAGATIIIGNLLGLRETRVKRILAYSGIAHVGYLLLGYLALTGDGRGFGATLDGQSPLVFYLLAYGLSVLGAFAVIGVIRPEGVVTLNDLHGTARRNPLMAACFLVFIVSLAGLPISVGFWAKLYLFSAAFKAGYVTLTVLALAGSAIGLFYYIRMAVHAFLVAVEANPRGDVEPDSIFERFALLGTAAAVLVLGIVPQLLLRYIDFQ